MAELKTAKKLDVTGQLCPWPVILTMKEIKNMKADEVLEVLLDNPPSLVNIPEAAKDEGHEVIGTSTVAPGVYKIEIRVKK